MSNLLERFNSFFFLFKDFLNTSKRIKEKYRPRKLEDFSEIKIYDDQIRKLENSYMEIENIMDESDMLKPFNSSVELKKEIQRIASEFQNTLATKFTNCEKKLFEVQRDSRVAKKCEIEFLNYLMEKRLPEEVNRIIQKRIQNADSGIITKLPSKNNVLNKSANSQKSGDSSKREIKILEDKVRSLMRQIDQFEERNQILIQEIEEKQKIIDDFKDNDNSESLNRFVENVFLRIQKTLQLLNPELHLEDGENLENVFGILENYIEDFKVFCNKENNELIAKISEYDKLLVRNEEEILELKSKLSNQEKSNNKLKSYTENLESEKKTLQKKIDSVSHQFNEQNTNEKSTLQEYSQKIEQLSLLKDQLLQENEEIKISAQKYVKELTEIKGNIAKKEEEIENMLSVTKENKTLTLEAQKYKRLLDEASRKNDSLEIKIEELQKLQMNEKSEDGIIDIQDYKNKNDELHNLNLHYVKLTKDQEKEIESKNSEIQELTSKLSNSSAAWEKDRKKLERMISDQKDMINTLNKHNDSMKRLKEEMEAQIKGRDKEESVLKKEKAEYLALFNSILQQKEQNLLTLEKELSTKYRMLVHIEEEIEEGNMMNRMRMEELEICLNRLTGNMNKRINCQQRIFEGISGIIAIQDKLNTRFGTLHDRFTALIPKRAWIVNGFNKIYSALEKLKSLNEQSLSELKIKLANDILPNFSLISGISSIQATLEDVSHKLMTIEDEQKELKANYEENMFEAMDDVGDVSSGKDALEEELMEAKAQIQILETQLSNLTLKLQRSPTNLGSNDQIFSKEKPESEAEIKSFKEDFQEFFGGDRKASLISDENRELKARVESLQDRVGVLMEELEMSKMDYTDMERTLKDKIQILEKEISELSNLSQIRDHIKTNLKQFLKCCIQKKISEGDEYINVLFSFLELSDDEKEDIYMFSPNKSADRKRSILSMILKK